MFFSIIKKKLLQWFASVRLCSFTPFKGIAGRLLQGWGRIRRTSDRKECALINTPLKQGAARRCRWLIGGSDFLLIAAVAEAGIQGRGAELILLALGSCQALMQKLRSDRESWVSNSKWAPVRQFFAGCWMPSGRAIVVQKLRSDLGLRFCWRHCPTLQKSGEVQGTLGLFERQVRNGVDVNHGSLNVTVAEESLNGLEVVSGEEQMTGVRMPERVR